jgi:hypothetical protein
MERAHRVAYRLAFGPFNPALLVLHTCDNPQCVNPGHLVLGTHAENSADQVARKRARNGPHLCQDDVLAICNLREDGFKVREIASAFGVDRHTVTRAIRRVNRP